MLALVLALFFLSVVLKVRENGMRVGIKDSFELVGDLNSYYDFAIAECHEEFECGVSTSEV